MEIKTLSVQCPTCKKEVIMNDSSPYRPFCSKRCRDIDFGAWATEDYKISENASESDAWSDDLNSPEE